MKRVEGRKIEMRGIKGSGGRYKDEYDGSNKNAEWEVRIRVFRGDVVREGWWKAECIAAMVRFVGGIMVPWNKNEPRAVLSVYTEPPEGWKAV